MNTVSAFIGGLVFGIGLIIAGMANPAKVLAFLDVAGKWDPSLALVMSFPCLPCYSRTQKQVWLVKYN